MKKMTIEEFICRATIKHENKYDYSSSIYNTALIKLKIICPIHGEFEQRPSDHLNGAGCNKCGEIKSGLTQKMLRHIFIEQSNLVHNNKYDYSKAEYNNLLDKIIIICPIHGEFSQTAFDHVRKNAGCKKCAYDNNKIKQDIFIQRANQIHSNKYDYSKTEYTLSKNKICIICLKHGEFYQTARDHLHSKSGCPKCITSKGENKIREWLIKNKIKFDEQKQFDELYINNKKTRLRFDFYLLKYNLCIEFDGLQHFIPSSFGSDKSDSFKLKNLELIQLRDQIKTKYCIDNGIKLLRIPYWKFNNIEQILEKELI